MSLHQEKDLGERFYGVSFPSDLYRRKGMNGGINPGISCASNVRRGEASEHAKFKK